MNWIPVSEQLPPDGAKVLVVMDAVWEGEEWYPMRRDIDVLTYNNGEWRMWYAVFRVTHWMALPELPEESL